MKWNPEMFDKQNIISLFRISNNNNIADAKSIIREDIIYSLEEINKQIVEHNISTVFNLDRCTENYFYSISQSSKDAINSTNILSKAISLISDDLLTNLEIPVSFSGTVEFYLIPEDMEWDFDDLDIDSFIKYENDIFTLNKKGFFHIETGLPLVIHDLNIYNDKEENAPVDMYQENEEIISKEPSSKEKTTPLSRSERLKQISAVKPFPETDK